MGDAGTRASREHLPTVLTTRAICHLEDVAPSAPKSEASDVISCHLFSANREFAKVTNKRLGTFVVLARLHASEESSLQLNVALPMPDQVECLVALEAALHTVQ